MEEKLNLVGVLVEKSAIGINGKYSFVYMDSIVESDKNVLYVYTKEELSDEDVIGRFKGTRGFEKIVREKL
jgi:hypothetical protein